MTRYEKILLIIFASTIVLRIANFPEHMVLFGLTGSLLILSYLFGGYGLLNSNEAPKYTVPILSGIALAAALMILAFSMSYIEISDIVYYLLIPNQLLFLISGIYLFVKRKQPITFGPLKLIFIRSIVLVVLTAFFVYLPITFTPYRKILYVLNYNEPKLQKNILMHEYTAIADEAYDEGDCEKDLTYALKANKAGLDWLGIDENEQNSNPELRRINGTYTNLYYAYRCKANHFLDDNDYKQALENFKKADFYIRLFDIEYPFWKTQKSWSMVDMAYCYRSLNDYPKADSLYMEALKNYRTVSKKNTVITARLLANLAISYSEQSHPNESNEIYKVSNEILEVSPHLPENREKLMSNYLEMTKNYLKSDSLTNALSHVQKALQYADDRNSSEFADAMLCRSSCRYYLNDLKGAGKDVAISLKCYQKQTPLPTQSIAECYLMLCYVNTAEGHYDLASGYLSKGMAITKKNPGENSARYANYLLASANLKKIIGDYTDSEKQYLESIRILKEKSGEKDYKLITAYSGLSGVETTLSSFASAKKHVDDSLLLTAFYDFMGSRTAAEILNQAGYTAYCMNDYIKSESDYREVIRIMGNYGFSNSASMAAALNGLGLIETERRNYVKANTLFSQSLHMYTSLFTGKHPYAAMVLLNIGSLQIEEGKLAEAEKSLHKSYTINTSFFKSDHPVFADTNVAFGDLEKKKKNTASAKDYYTKALAVYLKKFNESHWKIVSLRKKL